MGASVKAFLDQIKWDKVVLVITMCDLKDQSSLDEVADEWK
jgi:hypothetical protein